MHSPKDLARNSFPESFLNSFPGTGAETWIERCRETGEKTNPQAQGRMIPTTGNRTRRICVN